MVHRDTETEKKSGDQTQRHAAQAPNPGHNPEALKINRAAASPKYRPYLVDWRFLPESFLLGKDTVRYAIVSLAHRTALSPVTRPLWRAAYRAAMVPPVLSANRLFIHIPKSGGTSICAHLYGRNLPHVTASIWRSMYGEEIAGVPSFAVLRDPLERLNSAYRFIKYGGSDIIAVSRYDMFRLRRHLGTFEEFVDCLHDRSALRDDIQPLMPQAEFVCGSRGEVLVDQLFRMEGTRMPDALMRWLGIAGLPQINRSPVEPFAVTQRVIRRVEELYAEDFALFHER